jgi:molecular chaperone GrpE
MSGARWAASRHNAVARPGGFWKKIKEARYMEDANTTVETQQSTANSGGGDAVDPSVPPTSEALAAEREKWTAEKAVLEDLLLRRQADLENYRRRVEREKAETREFASLDAVQTLLPILDDFARSLKAAPAGYEEGPVAEYAKGIELIYRRLLDELGKLGLETITGLGVTFDPNLHNAVQKEERHDVDDQTVIEEYQRGYRFRGRLLRPAMVKVAVKP